MSEKKILYDDMVDPAFAEIYHIVSVMENNGEVESNLDCESLAYECRKLAYKFVEGYETACKYNVGYPDYWDMLDKWTRDKAKEKWPPLKRFDVLIDGNVTMTYSTFATNEEAAKEQARKFMESPSFIDRFRKEMKVYETQIGDVIQP